MDHKQQENRRKATQKFIHSLDELETVLRAEKGEEDTSKSVSPPQASPSDSPDSYQTETDSADFRQLLDDAVQDIEQFMSEPLDNTEPQE
jgi:hypothetical protein